MRDREILCLTGKGMENNALVSRGEWERRIKAAGHHYTDNAANCTVLVASRQDTIKAVNARARGVRVYDYGWLVGLLSSTVAAAQPVTDAAATPIDTAEMEGSALWGMF